jgi:hypothetical protein
MFLFYFRHLHELLYISPHKSFNTLQDGELLVVFNVCLHPFYS